MKNLKVSAKLILSFMVVIVLAVTIGAVGIIGMYNMNKADDELYKGNYLPTVMAGDISQLVYAQRTHLRSLIIYDVNADADAFSKAENNLKQAITDTNAKLSEYEDTIVNDDDRAVYNELIKLYNNEWIPFVSEIQNLGRAGRTEESKELLIAPGPVATAGKLDELTSKLQGINMNDGEATVNGNTNLFQTMTIINVIVLLFAVVVSLSFAFYISSLISKPLAVLSAFMEKAGSVGDITLSAEEVEAIGKFSQTRDELGRCVASTSAFIKRLTDVSKNLEIIASGDLTEELSLLSDHDVLGISLKKMSDNLNNMFSEINSATTQVATGSKQIADGAQSLAQGSTEQAASTEQLSSSISEIEQKTRDNSEMAGRAANLANTIKGNAEKGSRQMNEMMTAVKEINEASQSINKVIKVIDDIAFQTNILALNAAVEAARAGQHGKGFAVVAEEVRSLAAKSADAAKDTGSLIANSIEKAELGARIADETATSLTEIVSGINESSQLVSEIARSSEEQAAGITQINQGIDQVAQVVQQNSATAEESAAASEEMSGQSEMLQDLVAHFKLKGSGSSRRLAGGSSKHTPKALRLPEKNVEDASHSSDFGKY